MRLSRSELTVTSCWMFLRWNKFWLCPLDWNVDKLNMQKGSINVVCWFSNWLISKAIDFNSFDKIAIQMLLVKFGSCVKMIYSLFDQFFIRHIDGKFRSATAPLVLFFGASQTSKRERTVNATFQRTEKTTNFLSSRRSTHKYNTGSIIISNLCLASWLRYGWERICSQQTLHHKAKIGSEPKNCSKWKL